MFYQRNAESQHFKRTEERRKQKQHHSPQGHLSPQLFSFPQFNFNSKLAD